MKTDVIITGDSLANLKNLPDCSVMKEKHSKGRPIKSSNVRVTPEFRKDPDIEKLGRALIAIAKNLAETKMEAEKTHNKNINGDTVP